MAISEEHVNVLCNLIWSCYVKKVYILGLHKMITKLGCYE